MVPPHPFGMAPACESEGQRNVATFVCVAVRLIALDQGTSKFTAAKALDCSMNGRMRANGENESAEDVNRPSGNAPTVS